jgi:phosphoribosylaminoimidazolecarboxamide formyltransferase/IMP cyclohydrolase
MEEKKVPGSVLISVYHKTGLESLLEQFQKSGAQLISTGGTAEWLRTQNYSVTEVSSLTDFPEILEGRVKTLHPVIFGGILAKRNTPSHSEELTEHHIQEIDFVVVDLYPFEEALKNPETTPEQQIEKIDIGGEMKKLLIANSAKMMLAAAPLFYEPCTVWDSGFDLGAH